MKQRYFILYLLLAAGVLMPRLANAQSFRKGSLMISVSEGSTHSHFVTTDNSTTVGTRKDDHINGDRDPLIVEYGISDKWGIGLNMGGDVFHFSPMTYYNVSSNEKKIMTSELTVEGNYHFYVTKKWDLAACGAIGLAGVQFKGSYGEGTVNDYNAGGGIVRLSGKARYYFLKRFGVLGILSTYASSCTPDANKNESIARQTTTNISGWAFEFGLCYRVRR